MKKIILAVALTAILVWIFSDAQLRLVKSYARTVAPDLDKVLTVSIDTVTLGDNLEWRRSQNVGDPEMIRGLDSLKEVHADLLDVPTAYTYSIQYNTVGNFVFVQIDDKNNLLRATKNMEELFYNPGQDMPGYRELLKKVTGY